MEKRDWLDDWAADVAARNGHRLTEADNNCQILPPWTFEERAIMRAVEERRKRQAKP